MGDNKSEKFFKVFNDRMKTAQLDVKASTSVNVGEISNKAKDEKDLEPGKWAQKQSAFIKFNSVVLITDSHIMLLKGLYWENWISVVC